MVVKLNPRFYISVGDTETVSINYTDHLDGDELLTGTPTVAEVTTSDLTLQNKIVNTEEYTEARTGNTVEAGKAVQFSVSGGTVSNSPYTIRITVTTDATPSRTFVRDIDLRFT